MINRNIAYFITSNSNSSESYIRAKKHFYDLAKEHDLNVTELSTSIVKLHIIHENMLTVNKCGQFISFPIGNLGETTQNKDRYLQIRIEKGKVDIHNDFAGSIPTYFSNRNHLTISNIEPCTMLDSNTRPEDISYENIYGYMRFMHFIWDETAYNHIFTMLPDSKYEFDIVNLSFKETYLQSIKVSSKNIDLDDRSVANKLNEINDKLVHESLSQYEKIILPLSSGYDSRMILAACAKDENLRKKIHCFTYGSLGSIEVEAARRLTTKSNVPWKFIDLPCHFLGKNYLKKVHNIFGSSLHMHGMYQLEFLNEIFKETSLKENTCLTSGFMTGVPAGQHISVLNIQKDTHYLTPSVNRFSQSSYWTDSELSEIEIFKDNNYHKTLERRFRKAFDRFDGEYYHKSIMFDIWTRQRNFISYYPRTLEWSLPVVSPHMNKEYAEFFMSLSYKHLKDRYAVELMFKYHYPELAKIVSNSNGIKSINSKNENLIFLASRIIKKAKLSRMLPRKYANNGFEFNLTALGYSLKEGVYPLLELDSKLIKILEGVITEAELVNLYIQSINGSIVSYEKLISLQSLALSLKLMESS